MEFWKTFAVEVYVYEKNLLHIHIIQQQNKLLSQYIYLLNSIVREYMKIRIS